MSTVTPEVLWAQRSSASEAEKNIIYLTINAPDVTPDSLKLELTPTQLTFAGSTKNKNYAVTLEFYAEIDVENSTKHVSSRAIEYKLRKKEAKEEFWPRLLKESKKVGYVKTDFDKWVDEDEQEEHEEDPMAGAGMPEMGGMGGMGGMDLQSMMANMGGGAGGMDFSSLGGMGGMGDMDEDNEADEEIPELEGDSTSASKPSGTDAAASDAAKVEDKA